MRRVGWTWILSLEDVLKKLDGRPLLREFAQWLFKCEYYGEDGIEELLCKEWDGAYPTILLGDDLLIDIGNFLYYMAEFALEKTYGKDWWKPGSPRHIRIVSEPSYEDRSYVYVLELKTRTVLAVGYGRKTWNYDPESIERDLEDLIEELEESKKLLGLRMMVEQ